MNTFYWLVVVPAVVIGVMGLGRALWDFVTRISPADTQDEASFFPMRKTQIEFTCGCKRICLVRDDVPGLIARCPVHRARALKDHGLPI